MGGEIKPRLEKGVIKYSIEEPPKPKKLKIDLSVNKTLLVLMVVVILAISYIGGTDQNLSGLPFTLVNPIHSGSVGVSAPMQPYRQNYEGMLEIQIYHRDSLDMSKSRTEGTDLSTTFYKRLEDGRFVTMGSGDITGLIVNNNNELYFTVTPMEGRNLYISPSKMADHNLNPRVINFNYDDITQDGRREWIFALDISNLSIPHAGQTAPTIAIYTMSYDEANSFTLNAPSDIEVSYGNSINNIKWELNIPEKKAIAVNRVEIILDTSDTTIINEKESYISIPYIDNLELPELEKTIKSNGIHYRYELGSNLGGADYIATIKNGNPIHPIPVRLHTYLIDGEKLGVTLQVTAITTGERFVQTSDKVYLIGSSSKVPSVEEILEFQDEFLDEQLKEITWKPQIKCDEIDNEEKCELNYNVNYTYKNEN